MTHFLHYCTFSTNNSFSVVQIRQGWDNKCFHTKDPSSTEPAGCGGVCLKCWCVCSPVHADCCYKLRCNELITSTGWGSGPLRAELRCAGCPVLSSTCFNIYSLQYFHFFDIRKIDKPGSSDGVPSSPPAARGSEDGETGGNLHGGLERISF